MTLRSPDAASTITLKDGKVSASDGASEYLGALFKRPWSQFKFSGRESASGYLRVVDPLEIRCEKRPQRWRRSCWRYCTWQTCFYSLW